MKRTNSSCVDESSCVDYICTRSPYFSCLQLLFTALELLDTSLGSTRHIQGLRQECRGCHGVWLLVALLLMHSRSLRLDTYRSALMSQDLSMKV